ncbi:MAG: sodium-dependent transporter, partial [Pseudomonadales bacterium]|nr:sodium-dependent transporter [Pseudomonadales bacterium]
TLFIMLIGLVIFVLTLDNALSGVKFYLIPDITKLTPSVISGALSQAFFSLSLGMGILITYGSYMKQDNSIPASAKMVALADTGVAFLAGLLIIPAIFSFNPDTNTGELSDSSISLIFSFLPKIFLALEASIGYWGASIVASAFFLLVFFAALTSQVSIMQVPLASLQDELGYSRSKSLTILCASASVLTLCCILSFGDVSFLTYFISYAGQTKSFFDVIIDIFYETILPLNGFIICLFVTYKWRKANLDAELELGDPNYKGSLLERYVTFSLSTLIPLVLFLIFVNTVALKYFGLSLIG